MKTFAERLKYAMGESGLNQSTLSERTGASKAAISQYLSGKNTPGPERVKALADATGVSFGQHRRTRKRKGPAGRFHPAGHIYAIPSALQPH